MFNFTRQERQVILFLSVLSLAGLGFDFCLKKYCRIEDIPAFYQEMAKTDLNNADKDLLTGIPGIGERLALRIIEYRNKQAGFFSLEELKKIKGITPSRYEKIKEHLIIK
ncbi:MAG: helix-hairpin-helix domain-containing protein [Candidatus Omnitrophota bacterium]